MEFQIMNPQEIAALPQVRWNFDEIKRYAVEKADEYKGIAYTEDDAAAMKSDRADINRFIKAIEAERIKKKKEYLEPYNVFEAQVKEVLQPLREAEGVIARGLKEIDDKWRAERKEKVREIYNKVIGDLGEIAPFDTIDDESFYRKSISLKAIEESLKNLFNRIKADLTEIKALPEKYQAAALRAYKASGNNLSSALSEVRRIQQDEEIIEERKRKAAEKEAKTKALTDQLYKESGIEEQKAEPTTLPDAEPVMKLDFRVYGTREQILALRDFMIATDLKFERIGDK